jgi:hypothetical protein
MLLGVRKRALIGCMAVVPLFLYVFGPGAWNHEPSAFDIGDQNHGRLDLAGGDHTPLSEEASSLRRRGQGAGVTAMATASSFLGRSNENGEAYQEAVELFAESYGDVIEHTNPLVHKMLMHSEGADPMTKTEIEELGDLLSGMDEAPTPRLSAPTRRATWTATAT